MDHSKITFTYSQWMERFDKEYLDSLYNLKKYCKVMEIPGVSENFGNWSFDTQNQFVRWTVETFPKELLSTMTKLWVQGGTEYPQNHEWNHPVYVQTCEWQSEWRVWDESEQMREVIKDFTYFQSYHDVPNDYMWAEINLIVAFQLLKIYGCKTVSEVLSAWVNNHASREIHHLVAVVERWNEFSQYPIDWIIGLIDESTIH